MYVLRVNKEVPEYYEEYFYDEVVSVRNGIALVINEHVRDALTGPLMDFELLGVIKHNKDLEKFLAADKKKALEDQVTLGIRKHVVMIEDILPMAEKTNEPEQVKPWIDTLGD